MVIFISLVLFVMTVLVFAMKKDPIYTSEFELKRRIEIGEKRADRELFKKHIIPLFNKVVMSVTLVIYLLFVVFIAQNSDFLRAFAVSVLYLLGVIYIGRFKLVRKISAVTFKKISPHLYGVFSILSAKNRRKILNLSKASEHKNIYSKEEFLSEINKNKKIFADYERDWLNKTILFSDSKINSVMTPREKMKILHTKNLITPLVIDELYKSRQKIFVVMDEDETEIRGIIDIEDIVVLNGKDSRRAKDIMNEEFMVVRENKNTLEVFDKMIHDNQFFAIVEQRNGDLKGIVKLNDFLKIKKSSDVDNQ